MMTAEEARHELRITLPTLYRYTKSRKLAYIKSDGKLLFERADVLRFKEKREIRAK
jgi:excisionase family DNA binding protein